jgi:hypothetical protein
MDENKHSKEKSIQPCFFFRYIAFSSHVDWFCLISGNKGNDFPLLSTGFITFTLTP